MRFFCVLSLIMALNTAVFADQIFLKDGEVIKGKIIQITESEVEYKPGSNRAFDVVDKKLVLKIAYDNGQVVNFEMDILYRLDGTAIRGSIINVTPEAITYSPEGTTEQKTVQRSEIERIEYSDGKVVYITKKKETPEETKEIKYEVTKPAGGFHDSWVRIGGFFNFGGAMKGVLDKEERVFRAYRYDLLRAYVLPRDYHLYQGFVGGGGELDIMPPAIKFAQKRAFDFTGIKFGIRGRYGFEFIDSYIADESTYFNSVEGYEMFRGRLLSYHYWGVGPTVNLIFSPRNNLFNFLINFYAVAGQIFDGHLRAAAALRSAGFLAVEMTGVYGPGSPFLPAQLANITNSVYFNRSRFNGYTIRGGFGPHFSMNRYFPITFGINLTYAYSHLKFGRALPIYYDGNKRANHHEVGAEITAGVHF
jgi:hypothetical protein